jgi:hypothetical protein
MNRIEQMKTIHEEALCLFTKKIKIMEMHLPSMA